MNRQLPKVYANPINKELRNNKEVYYGSNNEIRAIKDENIPKKINEIFASPHHVYKSKVRIRTIDNEFEAVIVGKTNNYLLTLSGDKIDINKIDSIDRINL